MPATPSTTERTAAARAENQRKAAERALDDPVKLGRAIRIVRAGLEHGRVTLDELQPTPAA